MAPRAAHSASYLAESRATTVYVFYSIPIALEFLSTSLRFWAKLCRYGEGKLGLDDIVIVLATASLEPLLSHALFPP